MLCGEFCVKHTAGQKKWRKVQDFITSNKSDKVESSLKASGITEGELENVLNLYHGQRNNEHEDDNTQENENSFPPNSQSLVVVENFTEDTLNKVEKELQKVAKKLLESLNQRLQILPVVIEASEAFHDLR